MHIRSVLTAALIVVAAPRAPSLGINCKDSSECWGAGHNANDLTTILESMDGDQWAYDDEQIACFGSYCAYYQNTGTGGSVEDAKKLAMEIVRSHCGHCGSVPVDFPNTNDVNDGQFTIDYRSNICGSGACPQFDS